MDFTSFNSPRSPLIEKYRKPPEVKARASLRYIYPIIEPTAVPIRAPVAVMNYTQTI